MAFCGVEILSSFNPNRIGCGAKYFGRHAEKQQVLTQVGDPRKSVTRKILKKGGIEFWADRSALPCSLGRGGPVR